MSQADLKWLLEHGGNVLDDRQPNGAISRAQAKELLDLAQDRRAMRLSHESSWIPCKKGCLYCE